MLMGVIRSGVSFTLSAGLHGALLLALWLSTWVGLLLPEPIELDGGSSATMLETMAAAATLPPLDPDGIVDIRITLLEPDSDAPPLTAPTTQVEQTAAPKVDPPDDEPKPASKPASASSAKGSAGASAQGSPSGTDPTPGGEDIHLSGGSGTGKGSGEGSANTSNKPPCEPVADIEPIDATAWKVKRSLIEYYANDLKAFDRLGWVEPYYGASGKAEGLLVGLARCSAAKAAGLKHKDVVRSINNIPVTSYSQALSAWMKLRNESRLKVEVLRKGQVILLTYQITR